MKNQAIILFSKINKTHIQMIFMVVMLAMLVLGAGAVEDFGHVGR
jgi:hypothetical protein